MLPEIAAAKLKTSIVKASQSIEASAAAAAENMEITNNNLIKSTFFLVFFFSCTHTLFSNFALFFVLSCLSVIVNYYSAKSGVFVMAVLAAVIGYKL